MTPRPLRALLDDAARGRFPPADGRLEIVPSPGGGADAIVAFTGHFVLAADVDADAVAARVPDGDFSVPMSAAFLGWLGDVLHSRPATHDALLCAIGDGSGAASLLGAADGLAHPRVERASRYRDDVRVWACDDGTGVLVIGRGVCGRWEVAFEVDARARGAGLGRRLLGAARALVPAGEALWAQIAPGNAASMRAAIAAGFEPVGAEVLFPRPR